MFEKVKNRQCPVFFLMAVSYNLNFFPLILFGF